MTATGDLQTKVVTACGAGDFGTVDRTLAPIVEAARRGESSALEALLEAIEVADLSGAPIRELLLNPDDVEEARQATLLSVTRGIAGFEGRSRFTTWLWTVARREALQVLRRRPRDTPTELPELARLTSAVERMSSVVVGEMQIREALDALEDKYREVLVSREVDGLDYATIAEDLQLPIGTVKTRVRRGRQLVADMVSAAA